MVTDAKKPSDDKAQELADLAGQRQPGLLSELYGLLRQTRKWWLAPIIAVMLLIGLVAVLSSSAVAPLIYTLF